MTNNVVLKPKRDKPVRQGHPWIFSGAIRQMPDSVSDSVPSSAPDGSIVSVVDGGGNWLAKGYLNRSSQIVVRLLSWRENEQIDDDFWQRRLAASVARRQLLADDPQTDVYRLVNAESDYIPGLTVDRYADYLVLQAGTLAIDQRKVALAEQLMAITGCLGVIERSDAVSRRREGLDGGSGLLAGSAAGVDHRGRGKRPPLPGRSGRRTEDRFLRRPTGEPFDALPPTAPANGC